MKRSIFSITILFLLVAYSPQAYGAYDWYVDINIKSAPDKAKLRVGTADDATDGYDSKYEIDAYFAGNLRAYFHEPTWNNGSSGSTDYFWSDVRSSGIPKTWNFEVKNLTVDKDVTISWDAKNLSNDMCSGIVDVSLTDNTTGQVIAMTRGASHTYFSTSTNPYPFTVEASYSVLPEVVPSPTSVRATATADGVKVEWAHVSGVSSYSVLKSTDGGATFSSITGKKGIKTKESKAGKKVSFLDRKGVSGDVYSVVGLSSYGCEGSSGATATAN